MAKSRSRASSSKRVEASPEKRFFISMLVKDIELLPAIVDLVDNSVDGARTMHPDGIFKGLFVRLTANQDSFRITDNCGGIEADIARHYAFRFGRPQGFPEIEASVGQFGVGMKRALFKLGDHFRIESVASRSRFVMTVDVPTWASEPGPDWSFEFDEVDEKVRTRKADRGTDILVDSLHPQVKEDLSRTETIGRLRLQLSVQHQSALAGGLAIEVNGNRLRPTIPKLLVSKAIKPINYSFRIPANGGEVEARIVAGIAAPKERDDKRDEGRAEDFAEPSEAGWYVFCNDRLVLAADRTETTGWGRSAAAYHPQYRRFRGYVFLNARNSSLLPLNTTKTGLDQDSIVFRPLQQAMFTALANVAAILNRQKAEVQQREEDDRPLTAALDGADEQNVRDLPDSRSYIVPPPPPPPARTPSHLVNVLYKVGREDMERAKEYTGLPSAAQVGLLTFEYFMREEVDAEGG